MKLLLAITDKDINGSDKLSANEPRRLEQPQILGKNIINTPRCVK